MDDPTGSQPLRTKSGKPFEAGTRGFWKDYPNINALTEELDVGSIYTDFTTSAFWSPDGLEATAPVFGESPQWPSPLGQVLATVTNFKRLPIRDRLSIAGLLYAILDLYRSDRVFQQYDDLSAQELFVRLGVSDRMINDFLRPTLLWACSSRPRSSRRRWPWSCSTTTPWPTRIPLMCVDQVEEHRGTSVSAAQPQADRTPWPAGAGGNPGQTRSCFGRHPSHPLR